MNQNQFAQITEFIVEENLFFMCLFIIFLLCICCVFVLCVGAEPAIGEQNREGKIVKVIKNRKWNQNRKIYIRFSLLMRRVSSLFAKSRFCHAVGLYDDNIKYIQIPLPGNFEITQDWVIDGIIRKLTNVKDTNENDITDHTGSRMNTFFNKRKSDKMKKISMIIFVWTKIHLNVFYLTWMTWIHSMHIIRNYWKCRFWFICSQGKLDSQTSV